MCSPTDIVILYIAVWSAVLNTPPCLAQLLSVPNCPLFFRPVPLVVFLASVCPCFVLPPALSALSVSAFCGLGATVCCFLFSFLPCLLFHLLHLCVTWISAHQRSFFRLLAPCPSARPRSPPLSLLSFSFLFFSYASLRGLVTLYSISAIWSGLPCDGAHPCSYAPAGCLRGLLHGRSLFLCQVRIWHCFRHHATRVLRSPH